MKPNWTNITGKAMVSRSANIPYIFVGWSLLAVNAILTILH